MHMTDYSKNNKNWNANSNNPWAGLSSYEDPERSNMKLKFCGRDDESFDVFQLIDDNIFTTLYGKSGTGKSSLLNAGVFPILRKNHYLPVRIRLGMDALDISFQDCIINSLMKAIEGKGVCQTIDVVPMPNNQISARFLWSFFARNRFMDYEGNVLFPVIALDQFEEVLRSKQEETETLLHQIYYMMDENHELEDRMVGEYHYSYDFNFRFLVSIREDDLYRLEDSIDSLHLPNMKRSRFRLRNFTEKAAKAVILEPGEDLFLEEDKEYIANAIALTALNKEDKTYSTNILSLMCSCIFLEFLKTGANHISRNLVDTFVKQNPFNKFYQEATRDLSNKEKEYIENNLVDSSGRRNSVSESDFLLHVKNWKRLMEGDSKILQRTSVSSDSKNYRIELIHDSFCEPMTVQKEQREKIRHRKWMIQMAALAVCFIGVIAYVLHKNHQAIEANRKMLQNQARFVAEKARQLVDEGNSYDAQRLLVFGVLPNDLENPNRPYTPEAEGAFRYALNTDILHGHTSSVHSIAFSPNDSLIATTSKDQTVRIWDARTRQCVKILTNHKSSTESAIFSHDGKLLVTAGRDRYLMIWDTQTWEILDTLIGHNDYVWQAIFNHDDQVIASASTDCTVMIWDVKQRKRINVLKGHTNSVNGVSFSPDGKHLASSSWDGSVRIWDYNTGKCINILKGHNNMVRTVDYSPDGKLLVSASWDKKISMWDVENGKLIYQIMGDDNFNSAYFSPDGKLIAATGNDNLIRIYETKTGNLLKIYEGHKDYTWFVHFNKDGNQIVSASRDKTARIWNLDKDTTLVGNTLPLTALSFSFDGKRIATFSTEGDIIIWDSESKKILKTLKGHKNIVNFAMFSPDGNRIASASDDHTIKIWDSYTGKDILTLKGHSAPVRSIVYSLDGKYLLSSSKDKSIRMWNAETGKLLNIYNGHDEAITSASFSYDGKFIISSSLDKTAKIWDVNNKKCILTLKGHTKAINSAMFSHDRKKVLTASSDKTIKIWDAKSGKCLKTIEGHDSIVNTALFNSEENKIVSASADKSVCVWDVETGRLIIKFDGHSSIVRMAMFNPKGDQIVSVSSKGLVKIWDFKPLQLLMDITRNKFKEQPLTEEEKLEYYLK